MFIIRKSKGQLFVSRNTLAYIIYIKNNIYLYIMKEVRFYLWQFTSFPSSFGLMHTRGRFID